MMVLKNEEKDEEMVDFDDKMGFQVVVPKQPPPQP